MPHAYTEDQQALRTLTLASPSGRGGRAARQHMGKG
jgi:hypothetical protein